MSGAGTSIRGSEFIYNIVIKNNKQIFIYTLFHIENHMERKLREINGSYVITIPKQVCDLYNFKPNDHFSIEPIGNGELRIRKI